VKYLKGLSDPEYAKVDTLKMIHEISKGMAYLHKQGILHGDLKVQQFSGL
jgi:abelson tyrosine-protein kinase 1